MTDAMKAQIAACVRLINDGYGSQALRDIGYASAAIDAAMSEVMRSDDNS